MIFFFSKLKFFGTKLNVFGSRLKLFGTKLIFLALNWNFSALNQNFSATHMSHHILNPFISFVTNPELLFLWRFFSFQGFYLFHIDKNMMTDVLIDFHLQFYLDYPRLESTPEFSLSW